MILYFCESALFEHLRWFDVELSMDAAQGLVRLAHAYMVGIATSNVVPVLSARR